MRKTLRYIWQLPQNLAGLVLLAFVRGRMAERRDDGERTVFRCFRHQGGVSLGRYVFVHRDAAEELVLHELGHCRQSLLLGPLYLPVIGLPSFLWAACYTILSRVSPELDYFAFYTEIWANRLAGLRSGRRPRRGRSRNDGMRPREGNS